MKVELNREGEERARSVHKKSIVVIGLLMERRIGSEYVGSLSEIERFVELLEAGVTAANVTVAIADNTPLQAIKGLKNYYELFEKHGDKVVLATTGQDIEKAKREGKFAVIIGTQNADIIGDDSSLLPIYKKLGLRIIQLSYYRQNLLGEGCVERTDGGLSLFGIEVVEEMNRLGLLIDVSHCKDQVTMDAIKYSKDPVIASHANPRGLVNHFRNKTDEQIKALTEKGGVIGLNAFLPHAEVRKGVRPTVEDLINMADYVVKLVGVDHVGLGLDLGPFFDRKDRLKLRGYFPDFKITSGGNIFTNEEGVDDLTKLPEITRGLVAHGYSDQDIEKILGLNFLRVFKEVWGG